MLNLIPAVKQLDIQSGFLKTNAVCYEKAGLDSRLLAALEKLPYHDSGARLDLVITGEVGEGYTLRIGECEISIRAESPAGAFYAIQTLRQLFTQEKIPCLSITDRPDFAYRGFYHDVTRGRVPKAETIKQLVDQMAYYKLNVLQLYVEHAFEFEEFEYYKRIDGCMTREDLLEIGAYCRENFIDFQPSLSTFGHLYELLELPQYRKLRMLKDYEAVPNVIDSRMAHHTIDPRLPESIALIESLIDRYMACFDSEWFNICCDETYDLHTLDEQGVDSAALYVEFVNKIVTHVKKRGKKVMMWADILLKYPDKIDRIPDDVCFLNWNYGANVPEGQVSRIAQTGKPQIVCPGTTTWGRFCECVPVEEQNICRMAEFGYQHGAMGVLNTNWGDMNNPCNLEMSMYGLVLGAEKSWSVNTQVDESFYERVNALLYRNENGMRYMNKLSELHTAVSWYGFCRAYYYHRYGNEKDKRDGQPDLARAQSAYKELVAILHAEKWDRDEFRQEMILAAEGICMVAELWSKLLGRPVNRLIDAGKWLERYSARWMEKNRPSELFRIQEMIRYCDQV